MIPVSSALREIKSELLGNFFLVFSSFILRTPITLSWASHRACESDEPVERAKQGWGMLTEPAKAAA